MATGDVGEKESPQEALSKLPLHYIKGTHFRVVFASGVYGGITPRGLIQMNFFSERNPIPRKTVHKIETGTLGAEIVEEREIRDGFIREVEISALMDLPTAKSFRTWLDEKIAKLEEPAIETEKD